MRTFNFSAGPAVLPEPVLQQAAAEMLDWRGSGMSVMEMSHRGKEFICDRRQGRGRPAHAAGDSRRLQGAVPAGRRHRRERDRADEPAGRRQGAPTTSTPASGRRSRSRKRRSTARSTLRRARPSASSATCRRSRLAAVAATRPTCTSAPTRRSAASNTTGRPTLDGVPLVADMSSHILSRPVDVSQVRRHLRRRAEKHRPGRA